MVVAIGEPIDASAYTLESKEGLMDKVGKEIVRLREEAGTAREKQVGK